MATVTGTPFAAGALDAWSANGGGGSKAACVAVDDGDDNYIARSDSNGDQLFTFIIAGDIPAGSTINSVTVTSIHRGAGSTTWSQRGMVRVGSTNTYQGTTSSVAANGSYVTRTYTLTANPNTGLPWTRAEVQGTDPTNPLVQIGISATGMAAGDQARCTYLDVVIDYTEPPDTSVPALMAGYRRRRV